MIASSHHGPWEGPNRLWFEGPEPERSDGSLEVEALRVAYTWSFRGEAQRGEVRLFGPAGAARAEWSDTWHASDGMALHGVADGGVLTLYGTYPAGDGPEWGWRLELDTRDPEACVLRMFNVAPEGDPAPAVVLHGSRAG